MAQKVTDPALLSILNGGGQAPMAIPLPVSPQRARENARQDAMDRRNAANEERRIRIQEAQDRRAAAEFEAKFGRGAGGADGKIGNPEAKSREAMAGDNSFIETGLRNLAVSNAMNQIVPGGRFNVAVKEGVQTFPDSWKGEDNQAIAAYQVLDAKTMDLLKPAIALSAPPGATVSSQETNAAKELELAMQRVPQAKNERTANEILTNNLGQTMLDRLAYNTFMNTWRQENRSIYAKNARGQDAITAWQAYKADPRYQQTVARPYTELLAEKRRQRTGASPPPRASAGGELWYDSPARRDVINRYRATRATSNDGWGSAKVVK